MISTTQKRWHNDTDSKKDQRPFFLKRIRRSLRFPLIILILHGWQVHFQRTCCVLLPISGVGNSTHQEVSRAEICQVHRRYDLWILPAFKTWQVGAPQMSGGKITSNWDPSSWDFHNFVKSKINWLILGSKHFSHYNFPNLIEVPYYSRMGHFWPVHANSTVGRPTWSTFLFWRMPQQADPLTGRPDWRMSAWLPWWYLNVYLQLDFLLKFCKF